MAVTLETIRLLTVRAKTEGLSRMEAELAGVSRAHLDVARAAEEAAKITDTSARRQQNVASGWAKLTSEMQGSSRAAREYAQTARLIQQAEEQGLSTARQAAQARMMNQSRLQDQVIRGPRVDQSALNATLGIRDPATGAARASASAFEEAAREAEALERQVAALRAQLDPLAAVQARYNSELVEYRALASAGAISSGELAAAEGMVASRLAAAEKQMGTASGAVKLTSGQFQNLGYQLNDVVTMWALGAPAMQIFASQSGQVVQVLGDGPGGMSGSLSALKTGLMAVLSPTTLITAGFLAAGAAALYLVNRNDDVDTMSEALTKQADAIRKLRAAYGEAADAAAAYGRESQVVVDAEAQRALASSRQAYIASISKTASVGGSSRPVGINGFEDVLSQVGPASSNGSTQMGVSGEYRAFAAPILDLLDGVKRGTPDVVRFVDEVNRLASQNGSAEYQKLAERLSDMVKEAYEGQNAFEVLSNTINATEASVRRLAAHRETYRDLASMLPDLRTEAQRINEAFAGAFEDAQSPQEAAALLRLKTEAMGGINKDASDTLRDERSARAQVGLKGEAAGIAAVNERYDRLIEKYAGADDAIVTLNKSREVALGIVRAEAAEQEVEALRDRQRARGDMLTSLQTEAETIDMTRGAAMAYRREQELILALYREAEDAGRVVDPADIEEIKRATAAAGALTDQLDQLKMVKDQQDELRGLSVKAGLVGANDDEARRGLAVYEKQKELLRQNIDLQSDFAKAQVANVRALSEYEDAIRRQSDAWGDVRAAGEGAIDGLVDGLAEGKIDFESIANDLKKSLLDIAVGNPLKNMIGGSYGTLGDLLSGKPKMPTLDMAGMTRLGTMSVQAAVVNLNAAGIVPGGGAMAALNENFGIKSGGGAVKGPGDVLAYIRQAATSRGIDPETALRVIKQQSGFNINAQNISSREESYGLMQLNAKGGLGAVALNRGIDIRDPSTWRQQVDFGMDTVAKDGWRQWYGARDVGIGRWDGIGKGGALGQSSDKLASDASTFTTGFAQTTGALNAGIGQIADKFVPGFGGVLTQLLDGMSQKSGGGGSGLGGILASLGGMSAGAYSASMANVGGLNGFFADGGYTGPGGRNEIAGFVHGGEYVIPKHVVDRIGVNALERTYRGYRDGGIVAPYIPEYARLAPSTNANPRPTVNFNVVNNAGVEVTQQERDDGMGGTTIDVMIDRKVAAAAKRPGSRTGQALAQRGARGPLKRA